MTQEGKTKADYPHGTITMILSMTMHVKRPYHRAFNVCGLGIEVTKEIAAAILH
jgi:hypothetical protein